MRAEGTLLQPQHRAELLIAQERGLPLKVVSNGVASTAPNLTVAVYFTSEQLTKDNPDLVKRFTEAMTESLAYADAHPDEARQVLTSYTQIDEAVMGPGSGSGC